MIRRSFRIGLLLGLLGGVAFALTRLLGGQSTERALAPSAPGEPWPRLTGDPTAGAPPIARPVPDPAAAEATSAPAIGDPILEAAGSATWVEPTGAVCPTSHPVKGKLASKIFHLPGMLNYDRTRPDRCYLDAAAAEADGLRAAKR